MTNQEAIEFLEDLKKLTQGRLEPINMAIQALKQEPRKKGKWIDCGVSARCSNCGCKDYEYSKHHYCPNCGAKMESEDE